MMRVNTRWGWIGVCLLCCIACCVSQTGNHQPVKEFKKRLAQYTEECNTQSHSNTPATVNMFYNKANYMPGKCFIHCVMVKFNLVDKSGAFMEKSIREAIAAIPSDKTRTLAEKNIDACLQRASATDKGAHNYPCIKAFALSDCFFQNTRNKKHNGKE